MREYIIIVLIVNILVYLSCSIFELSFNLVVWEEEVRKAYAVFFFIISKAGGKLYTYTAIIGKK